MKTVFLLLCFPLLLIISSPAFSEQVEILGENSYTIPGWFKESFLEIQEDINDAKDNNKHVMLFMHIDRCPYCTRMLEENFRRGDSKDFIEKYFDVIPLNIRGDREIQWDEKTTYTEKQLARNLKVHFTPTIIFLDSSGKKVFQMNGYRKPAAFKHVLNYIKDKQYLKMKLVDYVNQQGESIYNFKAHPQFNNLTDFSKFNGPLAIIFEDRSCSDCDEFHKDVLMHIEVLNELEKFKVVRLDALSNETIIDTAGNKTTARDWAEKLNLDYRPGTVLFVWGEEVTRADGYLYHFHYKELLRYISGGHYEIYPNYLGYLAVRQNSCSNQAWISTFPGKLNRGALNLTHYSAAQALSSTVSENVHQLQTQEKLYFLV